MTIDAPKPWQIPQLRQLWQEAFGDSDAFLDSFFSLGFSAERCRCVTEEDRVTAALYWFDCSCDGRKMAYLYAVATEKDSRGRGLCRMLMENTHAHLGQMGYLGTILVPATEPLREMYGKMGYSPGTTVSSLRCGAREGTVRLKILDRLAYERRRRELLPASGVLQEGAMTALLQDQMGLFGGDDFILAAWVEDGVLHGEELLGSVASAPEIVRALRAEKGVFRIPGGDEPFAMYCPLADDCPGPDYFGLAMG